VQVRDVQEAGLALSVVDEGGLDRRLYVGDAALVDVADVGGGGGALSEELFEMAVLQDRDRRANR
jgi:hypothetical protein